MSAPSEKYLSSSMRKMCRFTSFCACARSRSCISSLLIHSLVFNVSVSRQCIPSSDCVDALADLGLRCPHMPETFSDGEVQMMLTCRYLSFELLWSMLI